MSESKNVEVIKIGLDLDIEQIIRDRVEKPLELNDEGKSQFQELVDAVPEPPKDEWPERIETALRALIEAQPKGESVAAATLLEVSKTPDEDSRKLFIRLRRHLKEDGWDLQRTARKGEAFYNIIKIPD